MNIIVFEETHQPVWFEELCNLLFNTDSGFDKKHCRVEIYDATSADIVLESEGVVYYSTFRLIIQFCEKHNLLFYFKRYDNKTYIHIHP